MNNPPPRLSPVNWSLLQFRAWREYGNGEVTNSSYFTGFLWRYKTQSYAVTNWHNVTGLHPETKKPIGTFTPNMLEMKYWISELSDNKHEIDHVQNSILSQMFNGKLPIWLEHPLHSHVDLVCIPIKLTYSSGHREQCLNDTVLDKNYTPSVGDDCFITGFPEGMHGPFNTPIWKRASIATEPDLNYGEQPLLLVDTIGNSGLSGSPVMSMGREFHPPDAKGMVHRLGPWKAFLGVYAGRMSDKGIGSQLGRVWKKHLIDEICQNRDMNRKAYSL